MTTGPRESVPRFLVPFVALSVVSGCTIGINKILMTLLGLSLHATNWQLGLIGSTETLGNALGTIPAGILVSRGSPRGLYAAASLVLAAIFLAIPRATAWWMLLPIMPVVGFCISFRIVSMNSSFLARLRRLGTGWAGWYKGTLSLGILALGPWVGHLLTRTVGVTTGFLASTGLFLAMAAFALVALPAERDRTAPAPPPRQGGWLAPILRDPHVRRACLMEGLSGFTSSFFGTFMLVVLMRDHGWSGSEAIHLLALQGTVYVSVLLGAAWFLSRIDRAFLDRGMCAGAAVALVGLGLSDRPEALLFWTALFALSLGFNNLLNVTTISASSCDRGHVSGVMNLAQMSGGCLGASVGGALATAFGLQHTFVLYAVPWFAALVLRPQEAPRAGEDDAGAPGGPLVAAAVEDAPPR